MSLTSFVMADRLPWGEGSSAAPLGAGQFDESFIVGSGQRRPCTIRSVSPLGAILNGDLTVREGEEVALELVSGQRPSALVEWASGGEAGVRFRQPIDVLALINRKLISQPTERRSMPRVELRCGVLLQWGVNVCDTILRNISSRGIQLEGDLLPPKGTYVSLQIEGLNVAPGEVMWRKDNLAGILLMEELLWTSLMPWIRRVSAKK